MVKKHQDYQCIKCGAKFPKWAGKCSSCDEWESIEEILTTPSKQNHWSGENTTPANLAEIKMEDGAERWKTEVHEFDRVLDGGISRHSLGLLGGEPGVGKSTLILQLLSRFSKIGLKVLYVSGEESANQIKERSDRLQICQDKIRLAIESNLERILASIAEEKPDFVVIDSIQTLYSEAYPAMSGSVTQVRESTAALMQISKKGGPTTLLIGHVTKEGNIAGPKTLEHMVDYVLYLESLEDPEYRMLRSVKNRFGSLREVGFFKMTSRGLSEISDPNKRFMEERYREQPGTVVFPALEGSRFILVEMQALVGAYPQNAPARTAAGIERNKLLLLLAVIEKYLNLNFNGLDVYFNLAGGFKTNEPCIDMAVMAAILSSRLEMPFPMNALFLGEMALTGEFRPAHNWEQRMREASRYGFTKALIPAKKNMMENFHREGVEIIPISGVQQLFKICKTL